MDVVDRPPQARSPAFATNLGIRPPRLAPGIHIFTPAYPGVMAGPGSLVDTEPVPEDEVQR